MTPGTPDESSADCVDFDVAIEIRKGSYRFIDDTLGQDDDPRLEHLGDIHHRNEFTH